MGNTLKGGEDRRARALAHVWMSRNPQGLDLKSCDLYHLRIGHSGYHHLIQLSAISDKVFHLLRAQLPTHAEFTQIKQNKITVIPMQVLTTADISDSDH